MDGYKIVYRQSDGAISDTFFGEPYTNISLTHCPTKCRLESLKE